MFFVAILGKKRYGLLQIYFRWGSELANFTKVGSRYRASVCVNGKRKSKTFRTKTEARGWALQTEIEIDTGVGDPTHHLLEDALIRYRDEVTVLKKGKKQEHNRINAMLKLPLAQMRLDDITSDDMGKYRDERLKINGGGTVNRELSLISVIFNRARIEWKWVEKNPISDVTRPKNPRPRDQRINDDEIQRVCDALGYAGGEINSSTDLVAVLFLLAIETAMRLGELCAVVPGSVHLSERYVEVTDSKNGDKRKVPLSNRAGELFGKVIHAQMKITSATAGAIYRQHRGAADMDHFNFHDTRHEAITRLAQKLDVLDLARMIGHRDPKSLMIYYNATPIEIASRLD